MDLPVEITYEEVEKTTELDRYVRELAEKLDKYHPHITSCRVWITRPHEGATNTNPFQVKVLVAVPPGHDLVAVRRPADSDPLDPLTTVVRSAFDAVERQLKELADKQRGDVKRHEEVRAFVARMFEEQGYGFIRTESAREIYFHRNSVAHDEFDRLAVGTQVRFEEVMGDDGPQATTVQIISKPGESQQADDEPVPAQKGHGASTSSGGGLPG